MLRRSRSSLNTVRHLIIDRDGVLNREVAGEPVLGIGDWRWIEGSHEAVAALGERGIAISVVTNQSAISRGQISSEALDLLHRTVAADVVALGGTAPEFFVCPHDDADACRCRKPQPGLVLDAIRRSGISVEQTVLIGDDERDLAAGCAADVAVALVRTGKGGVVERRGRHEVPTFDDLVAVARELGVLDRNRALSTNPLDSMVVAFAEHAQLVERSFSTVIPSTRSAASVLTGAIAAGSKILIAANGGSQADASHFAAELVGRLHYWRRPVPATVLGSDTARLTALANDLGYESALAREVEAFASPGDVLIAISTSGRSQNVIRAAVAARARGCVVICLTGIEGGELGSVSDIHISVPSSVVPRVQELHGLCLHGLADVVEAQLLSAGGEG